MTTVRHTPQLSFSYPEAQWTGQSLANDHSWVFTLTQADLDEIRQAIDQVRQRGLDTADVTRRDFPLPGLADRLETLRRDILNGRGFAVLRGLPAAWPKEDLILAYWGLGTWFGMAVSQNGKGHLLGHVTDQRSRNADGSTRIYQTNLAQPFHSDSCDIVGLLCLRPARSGGASSIASSTAIHAYLEQNDPAALERLESIFHCDRYGEIPEGRHASYPFKVFNQIGGRMVCCGMDPDIRSAQRLPEVPRLSEAQLHALDAFQEAAETLALHMMLEAGDIQLVNNHTVVHARAAFEDYEDPRQRRYLVRLWLSSPDGRELPEFMAERWGNIAVGSLRGGIAVPGVKPKIEINPDLL